MQVTERPRAGNFLHVSFGIDFTAKVLRSDRRRKIGDEAHAQAGGGKGRDQLIAVADDQGLLEF